MGNLGMQIFFVAFVLSPIWLSIIASVVNKNSESFVADRLVAFLYFVVTLVSVVDATLLMVGIFGQLDGPQFAAQAFLDVWSWFIGGSGSFLWLVALIGYVVSLFFVDERETTGSQIIGALVCSALVLIGYFCLQLIIAGVGILGSHLG